MEAWEFIGYSYAVPAIISIIVTSLIILSIAVVYYLLSKKSDSIKNPSWFVISIDILMEFVHNMIIDMIGPKFSKKACTYFIYLFMFLGIGNCISIFGFKEVVNSASVPLTFAIIAVFGAQILAVKYQGWSFFNKFLVKLKIKKNEIPILINPLEIINKLTPLISLTFRIWGNIIAGAIIYSLLFWALGSLVNPPALGIILVNGIIIMPFLFAYFTIFDGLIQAFVFTVLSISYWGREIQIGIEIEEEKLEKIKEKNLAFSSLKNKINQTQKNI